MRVHIFWPAYVIFWCFRSLLCWWLQAMHTHTCLWCLELSSSRSLGGRWALAIYIIETWRQECLLVRSKSEITSTEFQGKHMIHEYTFLSNESQLFIHKTLKPISSYKSLSPLYFRGFHYLLDYVTATCLLLKTSLKL